MEEGRVALEGFRENADGFLFTLTAQDIGLRLGFRNQHGAFTLSARAHTLRHFRDAFYRAELFDYTSAEQWQLNGAQDSIARAAHKVRALLDSYQLPPIDPATDAAVCDYIARRKAELGRQPQEF